MTSKQKNLVLRLANVAIWVPLLVTFVLYLNFWHHIIMTSLVLMFAMQAGREVGQMLHSKEPSVSPNITVIWATILPLFAFIHLHFALPIKSSILPMFIIIGLLLLFARQVFVRDEAELESVIPRVSSYLFAFIYPGLFFACIILLFSMESASSVVAFFCFLSMLNDGMAYFTGIAFGKRSGTSGILLASPNKSLVGFIGGMMAAIATALVSYFWVLPDLFHNRPWWYALIMGIVCGIATITGDLFESALKRSGHTKDSGNFFMGRGGILDTFDSLMFTAPFFFIFIALA